MLSQRIMPTILVVDDYDDTRRVVRMWLGRKGYRIVEAADGLEAVAQAEREDPDLILMDIEMPGLDGLDATRRIRALKSSRRIPIIAVSAYGPEQYRPKALEAGCTEYLSAPFAPGDLERLISSLLAEVRA